MFTLPMPRRMVERPLATVSGSFNRCLREIGRTVEELCDERALVLSPQQPITAFKEYAPGFLLLESDRPLLRATVRSIQDHHLECIRVSHFLVVVCPDGYVGPATAMEIGAAVVAGTPVYATHLPRDPNIARYIIQIPTIACAVLNHRTINF